MNMHIDLSYGVIPFRHTDKGVELLIVHQVNGDHWSFPKGHSENDESIEETARRELYEEAGIQEINLMPDVHFEEAYTFEKGGVLLDKRVTYLIGEVVAETTTPYPTDEIIEARWGTIEELSQLPLFPQKRTLLVEISTWMENHLPKRE